MRECVNISVNGVSLNRPDKWALTVFTQTKSPPRFRQVSSEVPGMDGAIAPNVATLEPATLPVGIKIKGRDAAENRGLHAVLVRALYGRGQLVQIDLEGGDGLVRRNYGRANQSTLTELTDVRADMRVEFFLPDPVWRSPTRSWHPTPHTGEAVELQGLADGTGPVSYAADLTGEGEALTVTDVESGEVTHWAGTRSTSERLVIEDWRAGKYIPIPAHAALSAGIESVGRIWPSVDGKYRVKVNVAGAGAATGVRLWAGRAWL